MITEHVEWIHTKFRLETFTGSGQFVGLDVEGIVILKITLEKED
jgi:hypothetical protein